MTYCSLAVDGAVEHFLIEATLEQIFMTRLNLNFSSSSQKTESESESGSHKNVRVRGKPPGSSDGKTRVRTVLNEKQLHTLR